MYIERTINDTFRIEINDHIEYKKEDTIEEITSNLNKILEKMIIKNPEQWIWTHKRWK